MRFLVVITILAALGTDARAEPSAEQLYDEGQRAYNRGDYVTAVARWQSSYQLSKLPLLVLNIAQAYRLAGDCEHALEAYRQYVALDPRAEQRQLAEGFIGELEPRCDQPIKHAEVPPVAEAPPVEGMRRGRGLRIAGLATGGAGIALVATSLWYGHRASTLGDEVTRACSVSCNWAEQRSKDASGRRDTTISRALDTLGAVTIAGGAVLYYLGAREDRIYVAPVARGTGAVALWGRAW